jgi:hypothetical protein
MNRKWAPAIKTSLGDVWHLVFADTYAACDHRLPVRTEDNKIAPNSDGPPNVYTCKRCRNLADHWNTAAAGRI